MNHPLTLAGLTACAMLATAGDACAQVAEADLIGTWATAITEQSAPDGSMSAWLRQTVVFAPDVETIRAEAFADPEATIPLFTYESSGPWVAVGPAEAVPGALALELRNDRSEMTAFVDAPPLWSAIGMGACPLVAGEAVDIADCVSGPPFLVAGCTDLDLVMVDEGGTRLRFGAEGVDRCIERPTALSETAFLRVE